jgi:hypothetical protein
MLERTPLQPPPPVRIATCSMCARAQTPAVFSGKHNRCERATVAGVPRRNAVGMLDLQIWMPLISSFPFLSFFPSPLVAFPSPRALVTFLLLRLLSCNTRRTGNVSIHIYLHVAVLSKLLILPAPAPWSAFGLGQLQVRKT